jgi:hypothetical protein
MDAGASDLASDDEGTLNGDIDGEDDEGEDRLASAAGPAQESMAWESVRRVKFADEELDKERAALARSLLKVRNVTCDQCDQDKGGRWAWRSC